MPAPGAAETGKVICFGELLLRLRAPDRELLLQSGRLDVHVGGAEANVAVGLARLGHRSAMVSRVPDNDLGEAALGHLRRYGVGVEGVSIGPGRMGLYFVSQGAGRRPTTIVYDRDGSSFSRAESDFDWDQLLEGADILHLSGITPTLGERSADAALMAADAARARGIRVSFDGNYRAQLWQKRGIDPQPILAELVSRADILFGNHRDVSLLLGREFETEGDARRREAALDAFAEFPNLSLIASTSRHIDDAGHHHVAARIDTGNSAHQTLEIVVADIVNRIGAGDAFAAGVLHGLLNGKDPETMANYGLALACLKHSLPGDASLFEHADIDAFLAGERDVKR
jgi:2-dehydro-3-deoxygluconokinase